MARIGRQESPTGIYHVMTRGINKDRIFALKHNKEYLLKVLKEKVDEVYCKVYSYCIMDNHLHLLIGCSVENLGLLMKKINISYASYYNLVNDRIGPVFQGRYKSENVFNENHALAVLRYIHNNPVNANMVSSANEYFWSSIQEYLSGEKIIIHTDAMDFIRENFQSLVKFKEFHLQEDIGKFLDVEEDIVIQKEEIANIIIRKYLEQAGLNNIKELKNKDELIMILLQEERFTYRSISELVKCSVGKVCNMNKISRP